MVASEEEPNFHKFDVTNYLLQSTRDSSLKKLILFPGCEKRIPLLSAADPKGYSEDVGRQVDIFTFSFCLGAVRRAICSDLQYAKSVYFGIEAVFFICLRNSWHILKYNFRFCCK